MSQSGNIRAGSGGGSGTVTDLQGDAGGPVPPTLGIIHVSGASTTYTTGNPGTSNMDVEVISPLHTFLQGTGPTTPSSPLGPLTNGQLIIGSTGSPSVANTITAGTNVSIINGAGSITINSTAGSTVGVDVQVFTTSGTYSPSPNMTFAWVQLVGGGGGGGGCPILTPGQVCCASGGAAGGYASGLFDAATIGPSQTVVIGAGGTAGSGAGFAGNGGNTLFGALMNGNGGNGGQSGPASSDQSIVASGPPGAIATGGDYQIKGGSGSGGSGYTYLNPASATRGIVVSGWGGSSQLGQGGGNSVTVLASQTFGENGAGYGSGGSGGASAVDSVLVTGGAGAPGIVIVTEYISTSSGGGGGGVTWVVISSNVSLFPNHGYIVQGGALTLTMPVTMELGQIIEIAGQTGSWSLMLNGGQSVIFNASTATTSISSTLPTDCLRLVCTQANTVFEVLSVEGNPTIV